tara:strand:- start:6 stop:260 length:255 start_codon:yes stop_codon:yes gene_type:complete
MERFKRRTEHDKEARRLYMEHKRAWNKNQTAHESRDHAVDTNFEGWRVNAFKHSKHTTPGMLNCLEKFAERGQNGPVKVIMPMK